VWYVDDSQSGVVASSWKLREGRGGGGVVSKDGSCVVLVTSELLMRADVWMALMGRQGARCTERLMSRSLAHPRVLGCGQTLACG
jgi:hypothetical protein